MNAATTWDWWINSDAGLAARVAIGVAFFAALAAWDLYRNRARAARWREYTFLLACVILALLYGVLNDQITTTISWEYFAYGKFAHDTLPPGEPPNSPRFRWEAAKIGMKATWTAGLVIGVALLLANNPRKDGRPRLPYRRLFRYVAVVFATTVVFSACLGLLGYFGAFVSFNEDFRDMLANDEWRPRRFMAVYGVHLGGYAGGLLGAALAVVLVIRARRL